MGEIKKSQKDLTIHQKINFRSHFKPEVLDLWFFRANRNRIGAKVINCIDDETRKPKIHINSGNRNDMPYFALGMPSSYRKRNII